MRNIRLLVEYDGTEFNGWQFQPNLRTIQGTLEEALTTILGESVRVGGSGRTDAGCHARGQVANLRTAAEVPCDRILRSLSSLLPNDLAVHEVREVPLSFNSRGGARERHYSYRLLSQPSPMWRRFAWYPGFDPARDVLEEAVGYLRGEHDFRGFAASDPEREGRSATCRVHEIGWREWEGGLQLHVVANRFLYHMVRNIVGTAVKIARGYLDMSRVRLALQTHDRRDAGPTAPPQGVCLEHVLYLDEPDSEEGELADWNAIRIGGILP